MLYAKGSSLLQFFLVPFLDLRWQVGRHDQCSAVFIDVFGVVVVKAVAFRGHDLARPRDEELARGILQHAEFDLAATNEFFSQQLAIVPKGFFERTVVLLAGIDFCDADR